jgi:hypothetical protein
VDRPILQSVRQQTWYLVPPPQSDWYLDGANLRQGLRCVSSQ